MASIAAIELENFQCITERVRIEFAPITLLYGPNSSGKSAIFDALRLIQLLFDPWQSHTEEVDDMIDRWSYRAPHSGKQEARGLSLAVDFEFDALNPSYDRAGIFPDVITSGDRYPNIANDDGLFEFSQLTRKLVRFEFSLKRRNGSSIAAKPQNYFIDSLKVFIGGLELLRFSKSIPGTTELLAQPKDSYLSVFDSPWMSVRTKTDTILREAAIGEIFGHGLHEKIPFVYGLVEFTETNPITISSANLRIHKGDDVFTEYENHAIGVLIYFGAQLNHYLKSSPQLIKADRQIPRPEALLTFQIDQKKYEASGIEMEDIISSLHKNSVDPHYEHLTGLAYSASILNLLISIRNGVADTGNLAEVVGDLLPIFHDHAPKASQFDKINRYLTEDLFLEKGYELTCESSVVLPLFSIGGDDHIQRIQAPAFVRIFLRDNEGRDVELHDVGSGIPFVMPVLDALVMHGGLFVQQPELHLHPALQASLADCFVDRKNTLREIFNVDWTMLRVPEVLHPDMKAYTRKPMANHAATLALVETHSEHFLLRLLRRVRRTEKGLEEPRLRLSADDLAIYYFDPQVAGGTFVTKQLVTPLGDFYSDWPKGFFSDRDVDLFDD